eukprot:855101-Prorocentrum_minimum.AAC.1
MDGTGAAMDGKGTLADGKGTLADGTGAVMDGKGTFTDGKGALGGRTGDHHAALPAVTLPAVPPLVTLRVDLAVPLKLAEGETLLHLVEQVALHQGVGGASFFSFSARVSPVPLFLTACLLDLHHRHLSGGFRKVRVLRVGKYKRGERLKIQKR